MQITDKEAQDLVDSYHTLYPRVKVFLNECKNHVDNRGYVESLFGRRRRFLHSALSRMPEDELAAEKREACNAPIQSTVADSVNVAIYNLLAYRYAHPEIRYNIVMQIHDALLLEVHKDDAAFVYSKLMKECMVTNNPIVCMRDDGTRETQHFAIESDMAVHWGEPITEEIAQRELGCTVAYLQKMEDKCN